MATTYNHQEAPMTTSTFAIYWISTGRLAGGGIGTVAVEIPDGETARQQHGAAFDIAIAEPSGTGSLGLWDVVELPTDEAPAPHRAPCGRVACDGDCSTCDRLMSEDQEPLHGDDLAVPDAYQREAGMPGDRW